MKDMTFTDCHFEKCDFSDVKLTHCRFEACRFSSCNLSNAAFTGSRFDEIRFEECKMMGINWTDVSLPFDLSFNTCLLDYSNFDKVDLGKFQFLDCSARGTYFRDCNLMGANFSGTNLMDANLENCILKNADFAKADKLVLTLGDNNIRGATLSVETALSLLRDYKLTIR